MKELYLYTPTGEIVYKELQTSDTSTWFTVRVVGTKVSFWARFDHLVKLPKSMEYLFNE